MSAPDIRLGAGKLKDGADIVREAKTKFDRDAGNLESEIRGMATGWQGQGGQAFQGLAQKWKVRHEEITRVLNGLAESLDETERDSVANDANVGENITHFANGLGA